MRISRGVFYKLVVLFIAFTAHIAVFSQTVGNWNFNNVLTGTAGANNTVSSAALSPSIPSGAYNGGTLYYGEDGWPTGAINTNMYLQITLTPNAGYTLNLTNIDLNLRRSTTGSPTGSGPRQWSLRSSVDGYAADLATGALTLNTSPTVTVALGSAFNNVATAITFRLYGYDVFVNSGGLNRFIFENIAVRGLMLLPMSFSALTGNVSNNSSTILNWQVTETSSLNYFEIERSVDGTSFSTIDKVYNSNTSNNFSYTDGRISQNSSLVFYRVKSVELNGTVTYSGILKLQLKKEGGLSINTIIASGSQITTQVTADINATAKIFLTSADGRTIYQQSSNLTKGVQSIRINNPSMPGIYVLTVVQNEKLISRTFRN